MVKKFGDNKESGYFEIDPKHLAAGLAAAKANKKSAIRITALDYRDDNLGFDADELASHAWIRRLSLDEDLKPKNFEALQALTGLTELATNEWGKLDFSVFKKLKELTLERGTALTGLDKLPSLKLLFLNDWRTSELPAAVSGITASKVILGASNKLTDITPVLKIANLAQLDLNKLTKLEVSGQVLLNTVEALHVEDVPKWTDFSNLSSSSLQELELFTKAESLGFLSRLPALKELYFWDVKDGNMEPVLAHPSLRAVYFEPYKKHYSHKEAELNALLKGKRAGAKKSPT
jgi:hypothetical protein